MPLQICYNFTSTGDRLNMKYNIERHKRQSLRLKGMVIDEFIIMPNHVHGIILIVGAPLVGAHSVES